MTPRRRVPFTPPGVRRNVPAQPAATLTRLRAVRGVRIADGCRRCGPLRSYAVVGTYTGPTGTVEQLVGKVWQVRDHGGQVEHPPGDHYASAWRAELTGGAVVVGPYSQATDTRGSTFISRAWALHQMSRALATGRAAPAGGRPDPEDTPHDHQ